MCEVAEVEPDNVRERVVDRVKDFFKEVRQ